MMDYLVKFAEIDQSKDGVLDLDEFCDHLHLPSTEEVKTIFSIYDIVSKVIFTHKTRFEKP